MSRNIPRRHPSRWEPPPIAPHVPAPFETPQIVPSATECTGLAAQPAMSEDESRALSSLYSIHPLKPETRPGQGAPEADAEVAPQET